MEGKNILAFRRKPQCIDFAKILESNYPQYPSINEAFWSSPIRELSKIEVVEWDRESLKLFCMENFFDMIDIHHMGPTFTLHGDIIRFDNHPIPMMIDYLNSKL